MANSVKPHIPKKANVEWLFSYLFWSKICGAEKGTGRWQVQNKQKIVIPDTTTDRAVELLAVGFFWMINAYMSQLQKNTEDK